MARACHGPFGNPDCPCHVRPTESFGIISINDDAMVVEGAGGADGPIMGAGNASPGMCAASEER